MPDITSNLVAWWKFDDNLSDSSGNGNNASLTSGSATYVTGKVNNGLSLSGSDTFNTVITNTFTDVTISAWFYMDSTQAASGTYHRMVDKSYLGGFWLGHDGGTANRITGGFQQGTSPYGLPVTFIPDQWNHIVSVRNGSTQYMYLNGTASPASQACASSACDATAVHIGGDTSFTNPWIGKLDEIRLYSRALSTADAVALYQYGLSNYNVILGDMW